MQKGYHGFSLSSSAKEILPTQRFNSNLLYYSLLCVCDFFYFNFIFLSGSVKQDTTHAHMFYLNLPRVVSNDEPQQDDSGQADQTLQGQRVHGAL